MARVTSEQAKIEDQIRRLDDEVKTHTTKYLTYTTTDARGKPPQLQVNSLLNI
jgi:hypothetical protein